MIYYLSNAEIPSKKAHSIQQMKMCQAFSRSGESVCFIHPSYGLARGDIQSETVFNYYRIEKSFHIKTIPTVNDEPGGIPDSLEGIIKAGSINSWVISQLLTGKLNSSDVIYSRLYYPVYLLSEWYRLLPRSKRPTLIHEHHNPSETAIQDRFCSNVDGLVCISKKLKEYVVSSRPISADQCLVAHDGVDIEPYQNISKAKAREETGIPKDKDVIMYTGHLYPRKGVEYLVEAAPEIEAQIWIVGGYEEDIERVKTTTPEADNVTFTGFVDPSEIHKYQLSADVLVGPYTTDAWMPSPLKLFEYMATGNPIVASGIPTIREVLTHERNALLVDPEDSQEIAKQISRILQDNELANKMSSNALLDVQNYTWEQRAKKILKFINRIREGEVQV